ncbi:DNA-binding domain protein [Pseudomonas phage vB_PpS_SYP]|nr:DNA-binding domain protein [Pseudomonas phage vB_PpS_SYP]
MRLVAGVGINDADYKVSNVDGKGTPCMYHRTWSAMLKRCYNKKWVEENPTYKDTSVCDEWLIFSNFKEWMMKQDWKGKALDKDLKGDGSMYSPETCIFIPSHVNSFFRTFQNRKDECPDGVSRTVSGKYNTTISLFGNREYLGLFDSKEEASAVWLKAKAKNAVILADTIDDLDLKNLIVKSARRYCEI